MSPGPLIHLPPNDRAIRVLLAIAAVVLVMSVAALIVAVSAALQ